MLKKKEKLREIHKGGGFGNSRYHMKGREG